MTRQWKLYNDATWQPIKPEKDEDTIGLSSTLELQPTNQMDGSEGEKNNNNKRRGFLSLETGKIFHGERDESLTGDQMIARRWLLAVISRVVMFGCWA